MSTYPIQKLPPKVETVPMDIERVRDSLLALKIGEGFVIPAEELVDAQGRFLSTPIGQRVHVIAKRLNRRVSTKKVAAGLRVRREE